MKIISWILNNILFIITLFFLAFIPLYPKFPIFDIKHTWVYIRLEDFLVLSAAIVFFIQLLRRKATLKTPLTIPIIIFWLVGGISTVFAIFFIFPNIQNVFPSIAILHFLRRVEYLSLFFIAFSAVLAVKDKKFIPFITGVLAITLVLVVLYGLGQKYFGFPAYLTMNEEFAKGIPLRLSPLSRVPSTFAGHYDLAAYLVLLIPLIGSMVFGFKNLFVKLLLIFSAFSGVILLLMTASRISFVVYLIAVTFMLILQKQKKFILPVILISIFMLNFSQGMSNRFGSTISQVDLIVDARTGKPIGIVNKGESTLSKKQSPKTIVKEETKKEPIVESVIIKEVESTGENLPQGTGYINLPSEPTERTITKISYERSLVKAGTKSAEITSIEGDFVVKKVLAYDVSFTTRFQGEWPRAIEAFKRNILLGSGYSSISLASDNDYLRILGETGLLGLASFIAIFLVIGIYIKKSISVILSNSSRSMVLGITAGIFGLGLNATLIDVFEASKIAFMMWTLIGIALGIIYLYMKKTINVLEELKKTLLSTPAIAVYLLIITFGVFTIIFNNYFIGDDFTWFRWAADCKKVLYESGITKCQPVNTILLNYFTDAGGFFYRPLTKVYFYFMYSVFWLNPFAYHVSSILIHFVTAVLVFILSLKILKNKLLSFISAIFFLVLSAHSEALFWISVTGHLFSWMLTLLSLVLYIYFKGKRNLIYLLLSVITSFASAVFYEAGIITPLLIISFDLLNEHKIIKNIKYYWSYGLLLITIPLYLILRYSAKSHWFSGDYSYNISHFIYNAFGNIIGYFSLSLFGTRSLFYYERLRILFKQNISLAFFVILILIIALFIFYKKIIKKMNTSDKKLLLLSAIFFIIPLLPFIGLGNISPRYVYLASFGVVLFIIFLIQKLYSLVSVSNKFFATMVTILIIFIFTVFNIFELQRINNDWVKAGNLSNKLLVAFNTNYSKNIVANPVFYFVNVPIRMGEAWVFPVGLSDALWFTFQNENLNVHISKSLDMALDSAEGSSSAKVFEFTKEGTVEQIIRTKKTEIEKIPKK